MPWTHPEDNMNLNENKLQVRRYYGGDHRWRVLRTAFLFCKEKEEKYFDIWILFHKFLRRKESIKAIVAALEEVGQQKETVGVNFDVFL